MTDDRPPTTDPRAPDEAAPSGVSELDAAPPAGAFPPVGISRPARLGSGRRLSLARLLIATNALLLVAVVLLALMVFAPTMAPIKLGAARDAIEARSDAEVEEVAARFARNFVTIDYRTIDADVARIRQDTTGSLREDLSRIQEVIREPYRKTKSSSRGVRAEAEVLSRTEDGASVRVVVRFSIKNTKKSEPQSVTRSLELTLVRTAAGWKVADAGQPSLPTLENS